MNYYSVSGLNGCLVLLIFLVIFFALLKLFAAFVIATLPFWIVVGVLLVLRNLYLMYMGSKDNGIEVEDNFDEPSDTSTSNSYDSNMYNSNKISRDAEDVEFYEYVDDDNK